MRLFGRVCGGLLLQAMLVVAAQAGVGGVADLAVTKSGPDSAAAGSDVVYDITLLNVGPDTAVNLSLGDMLPAGMTFVSLLQNSGATFTCSTPSVGSGGNVTCTLPSWPSGSNADFSLTLNIPAATPPATTFTNTATFTSSTFDPNDKNNVSSTGTTTVTNFADVAVSKLGPFAAGPDTDISYSLGVVNNGPFAAQNVVLSDPLPGSMTFVALSQDSGATFACTTPAGGANGTVSCSIASLASGASANFTLVAHVPPGTPSGTTFNNAAHVASDQDPTAENDDAVVQTTISSADLSITKTGPATIVAGQDLAYTITLSNAGPDASIGATFDDLFPAQTSLVSLVQDTGPTANCGPGANLASCRVPLLASGTSAQFTLTLNVAATVANGSILTNQISVRSDSFDANNSNDSASVVTGVTNSVDLAVAKSGPTTVIAGQNAVYTITLSNNGPDAAVAANFVDTFPPGTSFVSLNPTSGAPLSCSNTAATATCTTTAPLASGASAVATLTLLVNAATPNATVLTNNVTAQSGTPESNPLNNAASSATTVNATADLGVTKTGPTAVSAGSTISYTITAQNNGPIAANSVTLTDNLPASTTFVSLLQNSGPAFSCTTPAVGANGPIGCSIAALANGASASFTLIALVPAATPSGLSISNTAIVASASTDPDPLNNSAAAAAIVANAPDLALSKVGPANIIAGQNATYTLTLSNSGSTPAGSVQLTDALPASTSFVSLNQLSGPAFACTTPAVGANGAINCTLATLNNGESAVFSLVLTVSASFTDGATLTNSASATTSGSDVDNANNTGTASAVVGNNADLAVAKSGPAQGTIGAGLTYTLSIVNNGLSPANAVQLSDTLPASTQFLSLSQTSGPLFTCTTPAVGANGTVTCSSAALAVGATASFSLLVNTQGLAPGPLANTASASSNTVDANPANNSATATVNMGVAALALPVPSLSNWVLLLLAGMLAGMAVRRVSRSRTGSAHGNRLD